MNCSVIITFHDEGLIAQPTLRAFVDAANCLKQAGGEIELVIVADNASAATMDIIGAFRAAELCDTQLIETTFGEPGPARNAGVAQARHEWIAIHDGDEMVCETWFREGLEHLGHRPKGIAHCHWSAVFGTESFMWGHPKEHSPLVEWADFESLNVWSVQCIAARNAFVDVPYRAYRAHKFFEYEDWYWNAEVAQAGYEHFRVPDTVHGVRRKVISRDLKARLNRKVLQSLPADRRLYGRLVDALAKAPAATPAAPVT